VISGTMLACWGYNNYGELGTGTIGYVGTPTAVPGSWSNLALGPYHACALDTARHLWCWGHNAFGELGTGTFDSTLAPVQVGTDTWLSIAVGDFHSCGIRSDGAALCWGANNVGQLGLPHLRQPFFRLR
jgi:alpha-tubulin suppressor-like RCC1 family protein